MNTSMINASVSMSSLQQRLDIIANNVSNANTIGYKRKDASFSDILTTTQHQVEDMLLPGRQSPAGVTEGWGARLSRQLIDLSQGSLMSTDNPTDLALEGDGLFEITVPRVDENGFPVIEDGEQVYDTTWTRYGAFKLTPLEGDDENMYLAMDDGTLVLDADGEQIAIPKNHRMVIGENGQITIYDQYDEEVSVSQLRLVKVLNAQMLVPLGDHRFGLPDDVDRDAVLLTLDDPEMVVAENIGVRQGFLEQSNVDMTREMTDLISVQRSYQLSARALASADTMSSLANNLRG